jgi:uncharacterized protein (TIGR02466 family)
MKVNPIFSSFLAVENIDIANREQLISWAKQEINFNGTKNYKSTDSNHLDKSDPMLKELIDKIEIGFNELHSQMGLSNSHTQKVSSLWVNDGSDNSAIESPHRHVDGVFSAVYWPVADKGSAPLTFINPNNQMSYVFKSSIIEQTNEFNSDRVSVQPQLNQCVYFPSWLWHYVSHVLSTTNNRMSFAFNSETIKNDLNYK